MTSSQIFISYADQDTASAKKLFEQLRQENLPVWFESESLLPGQKREVMIREALRNSRLFLALVSSTAVKRGEGNKRMLQTFDILDESLEDDMFVITVRLDKCEPSHAKLKMIHSVDMFPDWNSGFQKIMKSVREIFPILPKAEADFAESLFDLFYTKQAVILLAQEGRSDMTGILKKYGEDRFGKSHLVHLVPPSGHAIEMKEYFSGLSDYLQNVSGPVSFMMAIEKLLEQTRKLFLLITRFEQGNETGNREFAGVLRSLLERHPNLYILICGSEKLADLYFGGELSLLNASESVELPENGFSNSYSDTTVSEYICRISGGHPILTEECLRLYRKYPELTERQCKEHLIRLPSIQQMFIPFKRLPDRQRLCALLENEEVEPFVTLDFSDSLIKRLYWKNLLKKSEDGTRLVWRSEFLLEIGLELLDCRKRQCPN